MNLSNERNTGNVNLCLLIKTTYIQYSSRQYRELLDMVISGNSLYCLIEVCTACLNTRLSNFLGTMLIRHYLGVASQRLIGMSKYQARFIMYEMWQIGESEIY